MKMFLCREPDGMFRLCKSIPERMKSFWKPSNNKYFNLSSKYGEILFPNFSWDDDIIEVNVTFGEGELYYITNDLSGTYRMHTDIPKFYSIFNKKANHLCEYWDAGKNSVISFEKEFGRYLFGFNKNPVKIYMKIVAE